jgi:hypothetical protein
VASLAVVSNWLNKLQKIWSPTGVHPLRLIRAICAPVLVALALAGCGGEGVSVGNTAADTAAAPTVTTSTTPSPTVTISGSPAASTTVGGVYSFTPNASDSDGGAMTFSIKNAPSWATFNTATGQLTGSPKSTDTGGTYGIEISVVDGAVTASLPSFSIMVSGAAPVSGSAKLSWVAPTKNSDGTALTNLAGYNIYFGTDSSALTQMVQVSNPSALSYVVTGLTSGTTWYFAVTSYSSGGQESVRSPVSSKGI